MRLLTPAAPYNIQQYYITCRRRLDETCTPLTPQCRIRECVACTTDHSLPSSWHYSSIKYVKQVNICTTDHIIFTLVRHRIIKHGVTCTTDLVSVARHYTSAPRPGEGKTESSFTLEKYSLVTVKENPTKQLTCSDRNRQRSQGWRSSWRRESEVLWTLGNNHTAMAAVFCPWQVTWLWRHVPRSHDNFSFFSCCFFCRHLQQTLN